MRNFTFLVPLLILGYANLFGQDEEKEKSTKLGFSALIHESDQIAEGISSFSPDTDIGENDFFKHSGTRYKESLDQHLLNEFVEKVVGNPKFDCNNDFNVFLSKFDVKEQLVGKRLTIILDAFGADKDMAKLYMAEYLWNKGRKEVAFTTYFDTSEKQFLKKKGGEVRKWVLEAKKNPFSNSRVLRTKFLENGLDGAFFRMLTCHHSGASAWGSYWESLEVFGAITVFGEAQCRLWAFEKGKRNRWMDNPKISANLLYQAGHVDRAFKVLDDAKLQSWMPYSWLCEHTLNYDKLEEVIVKRDHDRSTSARHVNARAAFYARQAGDVNLYQLHIKNLFEINIGEGGRRVDHIQYLQKLGARKEAFQLAYRYGMAEEVFKLLCLEWEFEKAHGFAKLHSFLVPEDAEALRSIAKHVFSILNHPLLKEYDKDQKYKSIKRDSLTRDAQDKLRDLLQQKKPLTQPVLDSYLAGKRDVELDKLAIARLKNGGFLDLSSHHKMIEEAKDYNFLSDWFYKKFKDTNRSRHLFLAGHYFELAGNKEKGEKLMRMSILNNAGDPQNNKDLISVMTGKRPDSTYISMARKLCRRNFYILQDGNYSQSDCMKTGDYSEAARLLTNRSLQDLELYHAYLKKGNKVAAEKVFKQRWDRLTKLQSKAPEYHWCSSQLARWSLACRKPMKGKGLGFAKKTLEQRGYNWPEVQLLAEHLILLGERSEAKKLVRPWAEVRSNDEAVQIFYKELKLTERNPMNLYRYFGEPNWF